MAGYWNAHSDRDWDNECGRYDAPTSGADELEEEAMLKEDGGRAVIEDGNIIIRLPIQNLRTVVEGAWAAGAMGTRFKVTDATVFADYLVAELNCEEEDGTTRIHRMFDEAINEAINQGAEGIEEHEDQRGSADRAS
jgi:hypothetical protein